MEFGNIVDAPSFAGNIPIGRSGAWLAKQLL